ncbi:hypothetical protein BDP67DRAFT_432019 [Colletotrichum lupini]|nr:hypothetical protein BDP67DRAFT_432019 [Colletotrichum lupini]
MSVKSNDEVFRPAFPAIPAMERPPTMVSYGLPFERASVKHITGTFGCRHIYILASKGLASHSDSLEKLEASLQDHHAGTWMGMPAHTPYDALIPILQDIRKTAADCIVTLGGGSLADGAKMLTYALANGIESVEDLVRLEASYLKPDLGAIARGEGASLGNAPTIPLVFIPTTLSGAEYSKFAGCTNPANHMKVQFTHPGMFAKLVILDPELCRSTPDWVWRSTGVRAIDHCVENICSSRPKPESDEACLEGLGLLTKSLLRHVKEPNDMAAQLDGQLGCNKAMTGLAVHVPCGASHGIGHNLGPLGVGHGQTSCILLPSVMKYNASVNSQRQTIIVDKLWSEPEVAQVLNKHGLAQGEVDAGDMLRAIFDELNMPKSLESVGVSRKQWEILARNSLADAFCHANAIPLLHAQQVKDILEMCSDAAAQ